ncbi:MAG: 6-phosphofructokinase [Actinomycetota bacterium]
MRVGVLTGGGDCPGLNAVIRAIVRKAERHYGDEVLGFLDAWDGVRERRTIPLTVEVMRGMLPRGGTVLGTRRGSPFDRPHGVEEIEATIADMGLDALVVVGGNGSLTVACRLHGERGLPIVGVPKTIDNDIAGTDLTFGFNTAVQIATDAIDRLHTTAESHNRVMVLEVMGRHAGWIGLYSGLAGGADVILIPEQPFDIERVCHHLKHRHSRGHLFSIVVVAEGAFPQEGTMELPEYETDEFGRPRLGGVSNVIATEIQRRTGFDTRVTILGHVQRGGTPTAWDRVLATRFGVAAIDLASAGRWGRMVALRGNEIEDCPLDEAVAELKVVPPELYAVAEVFFG